MGNNNARVFLAVPVDKHIKTFLSGHCSQLKAALRFLKWVHQDDYHITLKFLGDTDPSTVQKIESICKHIAGRLQSFSLSIKGVGTFGQQKSPQILWAGVNGDLEALKSLQGTIEREVEPLGFAAEGRAYHPHITIARKYQGTEKFDRALLDQFILPEKSLEWKVSEIVIYQSHLHRQPMYEALKTFSLM